MFAGIGPDMLRKLHVLRARLVKSPGYPQPYLQRAAGPAALGDRDILRRRDRPVAELLLPCTGCWSGAAVTTRPSEFEPIFAEDMSDASRGVTPLLAPGRMSRLDRVRSSTSIPSMSGRSGAACSRSIPTSAPPTRSRRCSAPDRSVDLYHDVVQKATVWPTRDHSIKTLAKFLGFTVAR